MYEGLIAELDIRDLDRIVAGGEIFTQRDPNEVAMQDLEDTLLIFMFSSQPPTQSK